MLKLRVTASSELAEQVIRRLEGDPAVSGLVVLPGASVKPHGDLVLADVAREGATRSSTSCARSGFTTKAACTSNPYGPGCPSRASTPNAGHPAAAPTPSSGPRSPNAPTRSPS